MFCKRIFISLIFFKYSTHPTFSLSHEFLMEELMYVLIKVQTLYQVDEPSSLSEEVQMHLS